MGLRRLFLIAAGLGIAAHPAQAVAQDSGLIITPSIIPYGYDRGRNVSVLERPRPDYEALGIRSGGFLIYPRVDVGVGFTSNVFLSEANENGDIFGVISPSVRATSDWSRHQMSIRLGGSVRRFAGEPRRKENVWNSAILGRADLGSSLSITGELQGGKVYETPFTGEVDPTIAALSSYDYGMAAVRAQYAQGRARLVLAYVFNTFDFNSVELTNNIELDQSTRDRDIHTLAVQGEYALSPSASLYSQLSYSRTNYEHPLAPGISNRSSNGYRALAGISMDLPAFMRGTVGVGYTVRDYENPLFDTVRGFSAEARVEYFPSELTTATFSLRRVIEDSSLGDSSAYFDNRVVLRLDHELRRNLLLNATAAYAHQDYVDSDRSNDVVQVGAGARYLLSNSISAGLNGFYSRRERNGTGYNGTLNELRGELSITFQR